MIKLLLIIILSEIVTCIGQIIYKRSVNTLELHSLRGIGNHLKFLKNVLSHPGIWYGLLAMTAGLLLWLIALAQGDLSLVFPIGSIQYIFVLFSAHIFLNEKIDRMKLIGTFLVVAGIILITIS
jgi:drug/metabolite transporter (DMT)-like permease